MEPKDPLAVAQFVLEEFSERAGRDIDPKQGGFTVRQMVSDGASTQRRYRGSDAPGARLSDTDVEELRVSEESNRAAAARLGVSTKTIQNARTGVTYQMICPECGAEQAMPNQPRPGCRPSCSRYGKRILSKAPPPFVPTPAVVKAPKKPARGLDESGHVWAEVGPIPERMRAWESLEVAVNAWVQTRNASESGLTSPMALQRIEADMERLSDYLATLRKEKA